MKTNDDKYHPFEILELSQQEIIEKEITMIELNRWLSITEKENKIIELNNLITKTK